MKSLARTSIIVALVGMLAIGSVASAQTASTTASTTTTVSTPASHGIMGFFARLFVHNNGKAQISGKVQAVGTSSFVVSTQGGMWTVNTTTDTKYEHASSLSTMSIGDIVLVHGTVVANATNTITAKNVNDKSVVTREKENKKSAKGLKKIFRNLEAGGTVQSVGSTTLTVTAKNGTTMTVNTDSNTKVYSKNWLPSSLINIVAGNTIRAYGTTTGTTTMNAVLIHNLSL